MYSFDTPYQPFAGPVAISLDELLGSEYSLSGIAQTTLSANRILDSSGIHTC